MDKKKVMKSAGIALVVVGTGLLTATGIGEGEITEIVGVVALGFAIIAGLLKE